MKQIQILISAFFIQMFFAQNVHLSKVEKVKDSKDKFFYKINNEIKDAEYLGEVEVQGFYKDDAAVFSLVYKKAKEIGANTFSFQPLENLDGSPQPFNASDYKINLYYLPKEKLLNQTGSIYLFSSSDKNQKISINSENRILPPRHFFVLKSEPGRVYNISTRKLLGSTIKIQQKQNEGNQYFQVSAAKLKPDETGIGGLNLKSGDIIGLEKSYAEFLSIIYTEIK